MIVVLFHFSNYIFLSILPIYSISLWNFCKSIMLYIAKPPVLFTIYSSLFSQESASPCGKARGGKMTFKNLYHFIITLKDVIYLFIICGVYGVNCFGCRSEAPIFVCNAGDIHSCVTAEAAKILKSYYCGV